MIPFHPEILQSLAAQRQDDLLKTARAVHSSIRQPRWRTRWARRLRGAADRLEP